jgi:hypothetical protein
MLGRYAFMLPARVARGGLPLGDPNFAGRRGGVGALPGKTVLLLLEPHVVFPER